MVVASTCTLRRFFFAASMPFLIAAGTSFALPVPNPTIFTPGSPTTTSAEKLRFLPPFTTLVTRLIETTCSFRLRVPESIRFVMGMIFLKLQSCFARRVGQRLHAAVIQIPAAVEHHGVDALVLGALGNQLPDGLGAGEIASIGGVLLVRGGRNHGMAPGVVDQLRVDVFYTAEHGEARPLLGAVHAAADARVYAQPDLIL